MEDEPPSSASQSCITVESLTAASRLSDMSASPFRTRKLPPLRSMLRSMLISPLA